MVGASLMVVMTVSFCVDTERDSDLVGWLRSQRRRGRSAKIREALREGLAHAQSIGAVAQGESANLAAIRRAIRAELREWAISGVIPQSAEDDQLASNLDGLEARLAEW